MRWSRVFPVVVFLAPILALSACQGPSNTGNVDDRPLVVASIYPVGDILRTLAGEDVRVEVLLPAGASPATFDVTPRQVSDLGEAALFVMVGAGLDEWVADLPGSSSASVHVIRLAEGMDLLADGEDDPSSEEAGEGHDDHAHDHNRDHASGNPHIWLDPILVRDRIVPKLTEALAEVLPESVSGLEARAQELTAALTEVDGEIREALALLEQRSFIVTHSAWSYFALQYGLEEAGVVHAHPGQDPSARELAHLLEVAREKGLECIFTEPQLGEAAVQAIATELSLPTCMLDPLGGPEEEGRQHYLDLMRFNAGQFADGLGGEGS